MFSTLAALVALTSSQWIQPRIFDQPNLRAGNGREAPTYFEFAPASGAGLDSDPPLALIRGVPSIPLSYTRSGTMFCVNADNTGTMKTANQACVAQGGLLVEAAATNLVLRSRELSTSPWNTAYVTATADYGIAPDGTKTAERIIGGASAGLFQGSIAPSGVSTLSLYVKGTSGSGTVCPYLYNGTLGDTDATACAYNSTSWTRCVTVSDNTANVELGLSNATIGGCTPTANYDILAWGAQVETGSVATSYIPTTSAAATRGAAIAQFDLGSTSGPAADRFSMAATVLTAMNPQAYATLVKFSHLPTDTSGKGVWLYSANTTTTGSCLAGNDAAGAVATGATAWPAAPFRAHCAQDGSALTGAIGGTSLSAGGAPAEGTYTPARYIDLGNQAGSSTLSAIGAHIGRVCLDPRPARCR